MECIDLSAKGIALVLDERRHLIGTVTDGDIRRAILAGMDLELAIGELLRQRQPAFVSAITAPLGTDDTTLLHVMSENDVRHIPLVDEDGCVVDVAFLTEMVKEYELPLRAVVMAGGLGSRLRPLTEEVPKPMLPIGNKPLLEHIVEQLKQAGIRRVNVATHYKSEVIAEHFKNGEAFGVDIRYVKEDQPLGTAGALSLLPEPPGEPFIVTNADLLTKEDFGDMVDRHVASGAEATMAVREYEMQVPFGVVRERGGLIESIEEKPIHRFVVCAGMYVLSPQTLQHVPKDTMFDMPSLFDALAKSGRRTRCHPIEGYWLDIGRATDYEKANSDFDEVFR